jgi:hypothetical protein
VIQRRTGRGFTLQRRSSSSFLDAVITRRARFPRLATFVYRVSSRTEREEFAQFVPARAIVRGNPLVARPGEERGVGRGGKSDSHEKAQLIFNKYRWKYRRRRRRHRKTMPPGAVRRGLIERQPEAAGQRLIARELAIFRDSPAPTAALGCAPRARYSARLILTSFIRQLPSDAHRGAAPPSALTNLT